MAMIYRELGKTGLNVSIIGFGASPLGYEFGITDDAEGARAVHLAIDKGINYFDVSPYYGRTLAEERLGTALKGQRQQILLATKTGRYDKDRFDFSARRVVTSLEESLKRLQTDYLDVFQVHDIEFGDKAQIIGETVPAMLNLKEQGKVRFVGVTGYPLGLLKEVAETAEIDMVLSYARYNLMDTALDQVLVPVIRQLGIGLVNASPLHLRVLTAEKGAPDWHPAPEAVLEAGRRAADWCTRQGIDISELALQFALDYAPAATTLVGMSKVPH
ncbi:unnamed protein product, partial [marine sediment metagenome]